MNDSVNRREVLQAGVAGAALAVSSTLSPSILRISGATAAPAPLTRYRIGSPTGNQNLLVYRRAVSAMLERSRITNLDDPLAVYNGADPLGWTFQGMVHGILTRQPMQTSDQAKQAAIDDFFKDRPADDPRRLLATATWATCPHSSASAITLNFLPWHRIYLYYFEKIARAAANDPT
jgi:tyrosinase